MAPSEIPDSARAEESAYALLPMKPSLARTMAALAAASVWTLLSAAEQQPAPPAQPSAPPSAPAPATPQAASPGAKAPKMVVENETVDLGDVVKGQLATAVF